MCNKKKCNIIKILSLFAVLFICTSAHSEIIFQDNFDAHPDWSPKQPNDSGLSISATIGVNDTIPTGYSGWRLQKSEYPDALNNTLNINSENFRGDSGKGLTYYSEVSDSGWASDGLLDIALKPAGYDEIYVRYYVKFQKDWKWATSHSPQQKMLHISHYDSSNSKTRYDYFDSEQNKPRSIPGLAKYSSGKADIAFYILLSKYGTSSVTDNAYIGDGGYGGTGSDFWADGYPGDGKWHSWEYHYKMNSADGVADGVAEIWYDGKLEYSNKSIPWVTGADPSTKRWNYVWLGGNCYNKYADVSESPEQWYAIDDVVISTEPIGFECSKLRKPVISK